MEKCQVDFLIKISIITLLLVDANHKTFEVLTSTSFSATSAQYQQDYDERTYYPNIEKHLYPLYIRYI